AQRLYDQHHYAEAHRAAEAHLARHPRDGAAMHLLARICANEGRLAEALDWCEKAIGVDNLDATAYYLRALVHQEQGRHDEARRALRQTLYLAPDLIIAHFTLGALSWSQG